MRRRYVFVGEKRSRRAIAMAVRWEDGRLAARTLHDALRVAGLEPTAQRYLNAFRDGEGWAVDPAALGTIRALAAVGYTVVGMGRRFAASVDAFAWEPDPDRAAPRMRLWFVSLLGPQQALKALWARLVKGELATLSRGLGDVQFCSLAPEGPRTWRAYTTSLPAAAGHQLVLLPEAARCAAAREDFLLLPRAPEEAARLHLRFLDRRLDLPLHAGWDGWLWERALRAGEALALEAEGIGAYRCRPNPKALAADISATVRAGALRVEDPGGGPAGPERPEQKGATDESTG